MDHFLYRGGVLHAEDVPLPAIAAEVGTPFYVYASATLTRHYRLVDAALAALPHLVCYSMKVNSNLAVVKLLGTLGAGVDVVSEGEYRKARAAGVPGERIVFSGVGKTRAEMRTALAGGVRQFNVESEPELAALGEVAASMGLRAPMALRVNPDVDAGTLDQISTGRRGDKFGVPMGRARDIYAAAAAMPGIEIVGVDMHIGSQITDLAPFAAAYGKIADLVAALRTEGHAIGRVDLGGGLGVPYAATNAAPPLPAEHGALIASIFGPLEVEVEVEPGRIIAGNAGLLVSRVIWVKSAEDRDFLILDAAMNDLVRPAMYGARHDLVPVVEPARDARSRLYDVAGPVCESTDIFGRGYALPPLEENDLVAFRTAGAYGAVMASEYNMRPLVPEVMVHGDHFAVIRARPSFDAMIDRDTLPPWL